MKRIIKILVIFALIWIVGVAAYIANRNIDTPQSIVNPTIIPITLIPERQVQLPEYRVWKGISVGSKQYNIYVAETQEQRNTGLSHVPGLSDNEGMVFVFDTPDKHAFWMKDMKFALDFVYTLDNTVVDIKENVSPNTFPASIIPAEQANYVFELPAGEVQMNGIQVGDTINLKP